MKVYRSPIEAKELIELAKGHEYGDTFITIVITFNFRYFVENPYLISFEEKISETISPNDSPLLSIEYKLVGIEDEDYVLLEVTGNATEIIDEYKLEMEEKRNW